MSRFPKLAVILLTASIVACESGLDQRYLDASLGTPLELPPEFAEYEKESSFELPEAFAGDDSSVRNKVPVLARVDSLQLQGHQDFYWLSVDEPVDNLYQFVKNFWSSEGYRLTLDEPVIGQMQTEWIYHEEGGSKKATGWFASLFAGDDLSASQNQFKTRIERDGQGGARIYIAHRGTEYKHVLDSKDINPLATSVDEEKTWKFRRPEPELEVEMLSRLMVYLGLQKSAVEEQVANTKLFNPRAFIHIDREEKSPFLIVRQPYQITWNRIFHNLERLNFKIIGSEYPGNLSSEGIIRVNTEVAGLNKEKSSFSFFSSDESEAKEMVLVLTEESHELTRIDIETAKGEFDTSSEGNQFMTLLYQQIK